MVAVKGRSGGARPGAGRPKGSKNRRTKLREAAAKAYGMTPLDFLMTTMLDPKRDFNYRLEAAKAAAPYVHPRLSQVDMSVQHDYRNMTDDQLQNRLEREIAGLIEDAPELAGVVKRAIRATKEDVVDAIPTDGPVSS